MTAAVAGADFDARKRRVLAALGSGEVDRSPKGGVDAPLAELIDWINAQPDWCTTSSCSGRISLYRHAHAPLHRRRLAPRQRKCGPNAALRSDT